jgi:ribosome recycling factor
LRPNTVALEPVPHYQNNDRDCKKNDSEGTKTMSDGSFDLKDLEKRMQGALSVLKQEFGGLRTGRASAALLDPIMVNAYGAKMPLTQVATVSVPESRMIAVSVWDKSQVAAVEKAIRESDLGLNPVVDGTTLRLPIPELNQERRTELSRIAAKYAEHARVSVRNVRRDGMETLKKLEKENEISEDEQRSQSSKVQDLTDRVIKDIDAALATKEAEIMQV